MTLEERKQATYFVEAPYSTYDYAAPRKVYDEARDRFQSCLISGHDVERMLEIILDMAFDANLKAKGYKCKVSLEWNESGITDPHLVIGQNRFILRTVASVFRKDHCLSWLNMTGKENE